MLLNIALLLSAFATGFSLTTVAKENDPTFLRAASRRLKAARTAEVTCDSIKNIICSLEDTEIFCEKVTELMQTNEELNQKLMGGSSFTVFAPTDEAFLSIASQLDELSEKEMEEVILFHFNEDVVKTVGDLVCTEQLVSLSGQKSRTKCRRISVGVYLKHQRGDGNLDLDQFPIINVNANEACDGIVHRLDTVMLGKLYKPFKDMVPTELAPPQLAVQPEEITPIIEDNDEEEDDENVPPTNEGEDITGETDNEPTEGEDNTGETDNESTEGEDNTDQTDNEPTEGESNTDNSDNGNDLQKPDPGTIQEIEEEVTKKGIGALGINLIIFSTLLLCFVFVCMRR